MDFGKAVRHQLLARIELGVAALEAAGKAAEAAQLAEVADRLRFEATGAGVVVRFADPGGVEREVLSPAGEFSFYVRDTALAAGEGDPAERKNAGAAERVLLEVLGVGAPGVAAALGEVRSNRQPATGSRQAGSSNSAGRWALGALLAVAGAAAGLAWMQGHRTFNTVDSSYLLENLHRMRLGEMPYRDFYLVLGPVHYWIQSVVLALSGGLAVGLVAGGAVEQALAVVLTYRVCRLLGEGPRMSVVCAALATVGGVAVMGFPVYDIDAGLIVMAVFTGILEWERRGYPWVLGVASGAGAALVVLTKVNIGVAHVASLSGCLGAARVLYPRFSLARAMALGGGFAAVLGGFAAWLAAKGAWGSFVFQTISEPRRIRGSDPVGQLTDSLSLHWSTLKNVASDPLAHGSLWRILVLAYAVHLVCYWVTGTHRRPLQLVLPLAIFGTLLGAFQSQVYGSAYGVYPLAGLMLCGLHRFASPVAGRWASAVVVLFALAFVASGLKEISDGNRLNSFLAGPFLRPDPFQTPAMRGLYVSREVREAFDELVAASEKTIPPGAPAFFHPGDAPFYFATGRRCPLPNFQVHDHTGLPPAKALAELDRTRMPWLIVRRRTMQFAQVPTLETDPAFRDWVMARYDVVQWTTWFAICKRKPDR